MLTSVKQKKLLDNLQQIIDHGCLFKLTIFENYEIVINITSRLSIREKILVQQVSRTLKRGSILAFQKVRKLGIAAPQNSCQQHCTEKKDVINWPEEDWLYDNLTNNNEFGDHQRDVIYAHSTTVRNEDMKTRMEYVTELVPHIEVLSLFSGSFKVRQRYSEYIKVSTTGLEVYQEVIHKYHKSLQCLQIMMKRHDLLDENQAVHEASSDYLTIDGIESFPELIHYYSRDEITEDIDWIELCPKLEVYDSPEKCDWSKSSNKLRVLKSKFRFKHVILLSKSRARDSLETLERIVLNGGSGETVDDENRNRFSKLKNIGAVLVTGTEAECQKLFALLAMTTNRVSLRLDLPGWAWDIAAFKETQHSFWPRLFPFVESLTLKWFDQFPFSLMNGEEELHHLKFSSLKNSKNVPNEQLQQYLEKAFGNHLKSFTWCCNNIHEFYREHEFDDSFLKPELKHMLEDLCHKMDLILEIKLDEIVESTSCERTHEQLVKDSKVKEGFTQFTSLTISKK